jgi:ribosomal protein S18 acetylase RimI-like enzyme
MTVLRPATPLDAGRIGAILSGWIDETPWMPRVHTRAQDVAHAGTLVSRKWVTVAGHAPQVSGFIARDDTEIHALYIDSECRGRGIGHALLQDAQAASNRLELWTFAENCAAQRFYERHGFVAIRTTDGAGNDEGLPDIRYRWNRTG